MLHMQDSVTDIVLSGKFATIGLYEIPSLKNKMKAKMLLEFFGLSELAGRPFKHPFSSGEQQKTLLAGHLC